MANSKEPLLKCRYVIIFFVFVVQFYFNAIRTSMGVSIVAMVNKSALPKDEDIKSDSCPGLITNVSETAEGLNEDGEFAWSPEVQSYILGCSFLCYTIGALSIGMLVDAWGCTNVFIGGFLLSSIFTFVTPFAAWCNLYLLILAQSLRGLAQASLVPAMASIVANWCPKSERGLSYTVGISGSCIGAMFGGYVAGLLCKTSVLGGWPLVFYFFGVLVSVLIRMNMYDSPSYHPKISAAELKYISENQENVLTKKRPRTPWRSLLTSIPVYALAYAYFGQMWSIAHFSALHSTFLGNILHYPIEQNGLFTGLPFLLQFVAALGSSWISNHLSNKNLWSVDTARKFWTFLSCFGFSICFTGIYLAGCNREVIVVLSIISLACNGFAFSGCWISSTELSPTFAASISSVACCLGLSASFISVFTAGHLISDKQTLEQWHRIIFLSIGVVMSSGIIFAIFGSAKIQPWNEVKEKSTADKDTKF